MTMPVLYRHNVTDALIAALAAGTGKPVGDIDAPGPAGQKPPDAYLIVDHTAGGRAVGDAADPHGASQFVYQVTAVARERWKAEALAGKAYEVLLGKVPGTGAFLHDIDAYTVNGGAKSLTVDRGLVVWWRDLDSDGGHQAEGGVSNVAMRYVLHVAPASG